MKFVGICNPCDYIIYKHPFVYLWELKSHKGKSIPFSAIREQQLCKLTVIKQKGVSCGFIFNFRDLNETYWVEAKKIKGIMEEGERKSISVEWCRTEGIKIEQRLKRTRYWYNVTELLAEI